MHLTIIPESLKKYMKNVYWLEVPHHGSKHSLTSSLIKEMNPEVAYISTEKMGKYLNQCTVNALSKVGCRLYSTHGNRTSFLHNGFDGRKGCSKADPMNKDKLGNSFGTG